MHAGCARRRRAIAAADRMVDVGERLLLWLVGACVGSALVVAVNAVVGA